MDSGRRYSGRTWDSGPATKTKDRRREIVVKPFHREAGAGPAVVCLHANASTSTQWRGLMDMLSPTHRVIAPDNYGAGKSPDWHSRSHIALQDEVEFLEPVLSLPEEPFTLVGHSYGGAVALRAALANPARLRALVLYEPTLFAVIEGTSLSARERDKIQSVVDDAGMAIDRGDTHAAAGFFLDYWMGDGAWRRTPDDRKGPIAASMVNVRRWGYALSTDDAPLTAYRTLEMPVLYMIGERSPASAHAVSEHLLTVLPNAKVHRFAELGHMGPVTNPDVVNEVIADFVRST